MASGMILSFLFTFHIIFILSSTSLTLSSTSTVFSKNYPTKPIIEKRTQLHFYFHDTITGKNPTSMLIVAPPKGSVGYFGATYIMDDPLTEGPSPNSKLIGRSQGIYAVASSHEFDLLMTTTFVFLEGIYNGSTISILGRNPTWMKVREMPIVGGSGVFRYARGFALAKTLIFISGVAIVEYNVSILHPNTVGSAACSLDTHNGTTNPSSTFEVLNHPGRCKLNELKSQMENVRTERDELQDELENIKKHVNKITRR